MPPSQPRSYLPGVRYVRGVRSASQHSRASNKRSTCNGAQMRDGAQNFQITQFGLSAFVWEPPAADDGGEEERGSGRYLAHTFNFWIFPRGADDRCSRRFLSQVIRNASGSQEMSCPAT